MKKNLILMMLLLTGAVSMNGQEITEEPIMVVTGNVVNTGALVSKGPIDLRTNIAKDSKIDNTATGDIKTPALTVGEFTLLNNEGEICVGCEEVTPPVVEGGTQLTGGVYVERTGYVTDAPFTNWVTAGGNLVVKNANTGANQTWATALTACTDGWRLPNAAELKFMYNNKATLEAAPGFTAFTSAIYWSSTDASSTGAWCVGFDSGYAGPCNKTTNGYRRCVRNN